VPRELLALEAGPSIKSKAATEYQDANARNAGGETLARGLLLVVAENGIPIGIPISIGDLAH